jgi:hypothetical protein
VDRLLLGTEERDETERGKATTRIFAVGSSDGLVEKALRAFSSKSGSTGAGRSDRAGSGKASQRDGSSAARRRPLQGATAPPVSGIDRNHSSSDFVCTAGPARNLGRGARPAAAPS